MTTDGTPCCSRRAATRSAARKLASGSLMAWSLAGDRLQPGEPLAHGKRSLDALLDGHPSDTLDLCAQGRLRTLTAAGSVVLRFRFWHRPSLDHTLVVGKPDGLSVSHAMPAPETLKFFGILSALPKVSLLAASASPEASTKKVVGDFSPPTARSGLKSPTTLPGPPGPGSSHSSRGNRHFQTGEHAGGGASRDDDGDRVRGGSVFDDAHAGSGGSGIRTDGEDGGPGHKIGAGLYG